MQTEATFLILPSVPNASATSFHVLFLMFFMENSGCAF